MRQFLASLLLLTLGAGCVSVEPSSRTDKPTDPIDFAIDTRFVKVAHWVEPAEEVFSIERITASMRDCDIDYDEYALAQVASELEDYAVHIYHFTYIGEGAVAPYTWKVTVLPNIFSKSTLRLFSSDYDTCFAGTEFTPLTWNARWVAFAQPCPDKDSNIPETPTGCMVALRKVRSSIDVK